MRGRRSIRRFKPDAPPDEEIERLLEAAVTAPSASNKQPWRFFVVSDRERIAAMASAVRDAVATIAQHVPEESVEAFRRYGDYFTRFEGAPVVIVPIHRGHRVLSGLVSEDLDEELRRRVAEMERNSGLVATSLAVQNLLLSAHARGLGASVMTGPLVAVDALTRILAVPTGWGMVALVPVGYPDEDPVAPGRKDLGKVVRWLR